MKLFSILSTLLSVFATTTNAPDLCDDVYLDASGEPVTDLVGQTLSRYCEWTGPDAPVWNANVCCTIDQDGAACSRTDSNGRCRSGSKKMYCEYAEAVAGGGVTCYQPFPSMCDAGWCIEAPEIIPEAQMSSYIACCSAGGACQWFHVDDIWDCQGEILSCQYGTLYEDGTVDCWD